MFYKCFRFWRFRLILQRFHPECKTLGPMYRPWFYGEMNKGDCWCAFIKEGFRVIVGFVCSRKYRF